VRFCTPQTGATAEYTLYTRSGRRAYRQIGSQQTDFLELGGQTLVQLTKVGATTTPVYLHPDLLGSPRKASSGTGALLWQEHYDPYGAKLNGSETTVGYTGHAHDATGLTYMKARFYAPSQHRFLTPDPIHFVDDNPFTFNRYAYGNNNPYKYTDPTGELGLLIHAFQKGLPVEGAVTISQAGNTSMAAGGAAIIVSVDTLSGGRGLLKNAVVGVRAVAKVIDAAKGAADVGRAGKQARLRELANDDTLGSADRGWIKQELNSIERGQRSTIRNPPGKDLAHERGREAAKGYDYGHSNLQDRDLHRLQHKYDDFGRANTERPLP
jgi:RHS repeat-associated protein